MDRMETVVEHQEFNKELAVSIQANGRSVGLRAKREKLGHGLLLYQYKQAVVERWRRWKCVKAMSSVWQLMENFCVGKSVCGQWSRERKAHATHTIFPTRKFSISCHTLLIAFAHFHLLHLSTTACLYWYNNRPCPNFSLFALNPADLLFACIDTVISFPAAQYSNSLCSLVLIQRAPCWAPRHLGPSASSAQSRWVSELGKSSGNVCSPNTFKKSTQHRPLRSMATTSPCQHCPPFHLLSPSFYPCHTPLTIVYCL